jgi:CRP/FNR family transcriptional regulator
MRHGVTKVKYKEILKYFSQFPAQSFTKGQTILKPKDELKYVYFIKRGFVRAYTVSPKGENTLNIFKPLFLISFIHFTTKHPNDYFFQAITPVEIYAVPYSDFKNKINEDKNFYTKILEYFSDSLLRFFINQGNIVSGSAQNKIASVLLQLAHDYGDQKKENLTVKFPATHRVIANLVGLTRETTSVQMSKLQKMKIISSKRTQFVVNDLENLKKLAQTSE